MKEAGTKAASFLVHFAINVHTVADECSTLLCHYNDSNYLSL